MPLLNGRYQHSKAYRPIGSRYSEVVLSFRPPDNSRSVLHKALDAVVGQFISEFVSEPDWDCVVIETVFTTNHVNVTLFEIKD